MLQLLEPYSMEGSDRLPPIYVRVSHELLDVFWYGLPLCRHYCIQYSQVSRDEEGECQGLYMAGWLQAMYTSSLCHVICFTTEEAAVQILQDLMAILYHFLGSSWG